MILLWKLFKPLVVPVLMLAVLFLFPSPVLAWLDFGHMAVARVAWQRLSPQKKARVSALLKLNPYYPQWVAQVGEQNDKDGRIFMLAATWPDQIKFDPRYSADGLEGGDVPDGASSSLNIGYSDLSMHKYWHFIDEPFATDSTALPPIPVPNAQTQITLFRSVLSSDKSDELKSYDLVWLLHIIGDIHQPLHCVTRVSKLEPRGDNGGNNVLLSSEEKVLHRFWDGLPGRGDMSGVPAFVAELDPADPALSSNLSVPDWVDESFRLARQSVYAPPILAGDGPFTLTAEYKRSALSIARARVELAGERLAHIINDELK